MLLALGGSGGGEVTETQAGFTSTGLTRPRETRDMAASWTQGRFSE
eukprot:CCRYP_020969-RA/>CCRYP_020969-RA protein AED:0.14 eAED:0.51 QI:38/0/0.5/1/0/0/2/290/45